MYEVQLTNFSHDYYFAQHFDTIEEVERFALEQWKLYTKKYHIKGYYISWLGRKFANFNMYKSTLEKQIEVTNMNTFRFFSDGHVIHLKVEIKKIKD